MSDNYQAVYDAVRSRFHGCDAGEAVERVVRESFGMASHYMACVSQEWTSAAHEQQRPSAIYRPAISIDGNQWCALYGDDLQSGVAGFGDSPELAMRDFDANWCKHLATPFPQDKGDES